MNKEISKLNDKYLNEKKEYNKVITILAILRLLSFILTILFLILGIIQKNIIYYIFMSLFLITFIIFLVIHMKKFKKLDNILFKLAVIKDYESRTNDTWKNFKDKGEEFLISNLYYQTDLDIYGYGSLYQYINVAKTAYGRRRVSELLTDSKTTKEDILFSQEAVCELSNNVKCHIELEALLRNYYKISQEDRPRQMDNAINNISNKVELKKGSLCVAILSIIVVLTVIILSIFKVVPYIIIPIVILLNFLITSYFSNIGEINSNLITVGNLFLGYNDIIKYIEVNDFNSKELNNIKNDIMTNKKALKEFNIINSFISSSNNIIYRIIFDGLFSIDTFMFYLFVKWQKKKCDSIKNIALSIAKLEGLLSLSVIGLVKDTHVVPKVSQEFKFEGLYHPLISENNAVKNDFKFEGMNIITGSNMSGKTTFMRTIGVNYLLFKAGGIVCANSFNAGIYKIMTSMKVVDEMTNGISTFYGEVLRIKSIVEESENDENLLVLVDEIFKGTNTLDRLTGAKAFIEKINKSNIKAIITTHDFELCNIKGVNNYHFLEHYIDDKIKFDYKIHDGISQTRNAIYLLKIAGIIND